MKAKVALILMVSVPFNLGLFQTLSVSASPNSTRMYVYPPLVVRMTGQTFTVDIKISDVINLFSWQFTLEWNATVLDFISVVEGEFLKRQPKGTFFVNVTEQDDIENDSIVASCAITAPYEERPGVNGSGTLATVTFRVQSAGETPLHFVNPGDELGADTALLDCDAKYISFTAEDGYFSTRAISTITVDVAPATVTVGSNVTINGTITPLKVGVDVTISYRLSGGTWSTLATVRTDSESHYIHVWKTTDAGTYQIKARWSGDANTLPAESETKTVTVEAPEQPDSTPPTTLHNYDGLWHTTDFTITLTATDDLSGVAETYYKINDDVTKTVSADGQPRITTESANNKLEYWSVDKNDNVEIHKILTEIKLDKTAPTGSITINEGATYTTSTSVILSLTATDTTSGVTQMRFSNDGTTWTLWEDYATSKSWTLPTGEGTKTIYVQYMDNAGLSSSYQDNITLDTTKPTANAGTDQTVLQGTTVTFDGSGSTDNIGITSYAWIFTDVTLRTLTGLKPTYTFKKIGNFQVTLNVSDYAGNWNTDTMWVTVLADTVSPTANAGPDQTVNEDTLVTFDGSASTDNVGINIYTWTFTDGTNKTLTGKKPTYTFNTPGVYTITLNVTDAAGNWATDTVVVTVLDITKPVANAGQNQIVNVGSSVTFDASGSSDNVGVVSYEWDFGDETTGTGITTTHTYTNPGTYIVTLTVEDAAGNTQTHSITVTVLPAESSFPIWTVGAAFAAIGIAIAATFLWRRRK